MRDKIETWWDSFVQLKWWIQAIIIIAITVGIHHWILHQDKLCQNIKQGVKWLKPNTQKNQEKANLILMAKRSLKKSDIVIGDKSYNFHKIIWEDITGDSTIASSDDFNKMKTSLIVTYAYIYKKNENYLWTFASYSDDGYFGDRNIIPVGVIQKIEKIII